MATKIIAQKRGMTIIPVDSDGVEALHNIPQGELFSITIVRPRNIKMHRKFFKMIQEVFYAVSDIQKSLNGWTNVDYMLDEIKIELGHCRKCVRKDGTISYMPLSISFANMDQSAFELFYNKFLDYCIQVIIPGVNKEDFERHLYSIMDGRNYSQ